jgi:hypothetical protein
MTIGKDKRPRDPVLPLSAVANTALIELCDAIWEARKTGTCCFFGSFRQLFHGLDARCLIELYSGM